MAIKKSKEENFTVKCSIEHLFVKSEKSLNEGGFRNLITNNIK
jgi:hypothetical protein